MQKVISYFKTLWIQVPPRKMLYPPNCALSAFLAAKWIGKLLQMFVLGFRQLSWLTEGVCELVVEAALLQS